MDIIKRQCSLFFSADPPKLSLAVGSSLNLTNIKEGADVYFECSVHARPNIDKILWYLNVSLKYKLVL